MFVVGSATEEEMATAAAAEIRHEYDVQVYSLSERGAPRTGTLTVIAPPQSYGVVAEVVRAQFGDEVFFNYQRGAEVH